MDKYDRKDWQLPDSGLETAISIDRLEKQKFSASTVAFISFRTELRVMLADAARWGNPNTDLTYPITTLADCKFSNLVYQVQCAKCDAFYIGEMGQILSKLINGYQFTCVIYRH